MTSARRDWTRSFQMEEFDSGPSWPSSPKCNRSCSAWTLLSAHCSCLSALLRKCWPWHSNHRAHRAWTESVAFPLVSDSVEVTRLSYCFDWVLLKVGLEMEILKLLLCLRDCLINLLHISSWGSKGCFLLIRLVVLEKVWIVNELLVLNELLRLLRIVRRPMRYGPAIFISHYSLIYYPT